MKALGKVLILAGGLFLFLMGHVQVTNHILITAIMTVPIQMVGAHFLSS